MSQKKSKGAIIGCGTRGVDAFAKEISNRQDCKINALCDLNKVRVKLAAEKIAGNPACYSSLTEMLSKEKLDFAVIATPDYCHESNALETLNSGINVLIDKPLATTVKGCRNIIQAAEKAGKIAMIGFNLRHYAVIKRLKQLISDGILGRVFLIENREFYEGGRTYMSRWNRFYEKSGGLWIHKGSHDFDVFNWLLDFPRPVRVSAFAGVDVFKPEGIPFEVAPGTRVGPTCSKCLYKEKCPDAYKLSNIQHGLWSDSAADEDGYFKDLCMYTSKKDTHDNGIAIVEYENGAKASHMECFVTSVSDRRYTIVGDKGQAEASLADLKITVHPRWSREVITYDIPPEEGGHSGADPALVDYFIKVIKGEEKNRSTVEHGLWSTAIGQAAELSRREKRMVCLDELFG
jgi:predicted dehydrogenase